MNEENAGDASNPPKFNCKCCGYLTLPHPYSRYDSCEVCFWEADLGEDPYEVTSPNNLSLNEGRLTFVTHGAKRSDIAVYVRLPRPDDMPVQADPKGRISPDRMKADVVAQRAERR